MGRKKISTNVNSLIDMEDDEEKSKFRKRRSVNYNKKYVDSSDDSTADTPNASEDTNFKPPAKKAKEEDKFMKSSYCLKTRIQRLIQLCIRVDTPLNQEDITSSNDITQNSNRFISSLNSLNKKVDEITQVYASLNKPSSSQSQNTENKILKSLNNLTERVDKLIEIFEIKNNQQESPSTSEDTTVASPTPSTYMYNDVDLLQITAENSHKYALQVTDVLFTRQELSVILILDHGKLWATDRTAMDATRLEILKNSIKYKYSYSSTEFEKEWPQIRAAVNRKCRAAKAEMKKKHVETSQDD